jgi:hypothetical protein
MRSRRDGPAWPPLRFEPRRAPDSTRGSIGDRGRCCRGADQGLDRACSSEAMPRLGECDRVLSPVRDRTVSRDGAAGYASETGADQRAARFCSRSANVGGNHIRGSICHSAFPSEKPGLARMRHVQGTIRARSGHGRACSVVATVRELRKHWSRSRSNLCPGRSSGVAPMRAWVDVSPSNRW